MKKILKRTNKKFEGLDISLVECIQSGYMFKIKDCLCLTAYNEDTEKYFFEFNSNIDNFDKRYELKKMIGNGEIKGFLDFLGYNSLKKYLKENDFLHIISDLQSYNGVFFQFYSYNEQYTINQIIDTLNNFSK